MSSASSTPPSSRLTSSSRAAWWSGSAPAPRQGSPFSTSARVSGEGRSLASSGYPPRSLICASEAEKAGIQVSSSEEKPKIDFAFTDADVIEEGTLAAVIGRRKIETGEPSFIQEKGIVKSAGMVAFIIDKDKYVKGVEGSIPVLIKSGNWIDTAEEIDDLFLGDAEVWRRPSIGTAGPSGGDFPLVTKEGYHILDVIFTTPIEDLGKVAEGLEEIIGVVDHGIICNTKPYAVIASKGEVQVLDQKSSVIPNT